MLGESWDNIAIPEQNSMRIQLDHSLDRAKRIMKVLGLILGKRFGEHHISYLFLCIVIVCVRVHVSLII